MTNDHQQKDGKVICAGIEVVNLYPWRATDPKDLPKGPEVFDRA